MQRLWKHAPLTILSLGTLLMALPAHASVWDILHDDIDAAQLSQKTDSGQELHLRQEALREGVDELLPMFPASAKGTLEVVREARTGEFLSVEIGKITVVFHDVPLKEWFAPYVRTMAEKQVVGGYLDAQGNPLGEFRPANNVTLEELAKIVVSLTGGIRSDCPAKPLNVTASGSWSASFVSCAEARGWALYSDGTVDVKRPATRGEVVLTVLQAYNKDISAPTGTGFTDVPASIQTAGAIEKAAHDGIVIGYTDAQGNALGTFGPNNPVTRAELAKILTLSDEIERKK